jgi:hypothetical protein
MTKNMQQCYREVMEGVQLKVHIHPDSNYRQHEIDMSNQAPKAKVEPKIKSEAMPASALVKKENKQEIISRSNKSSMSDLSGLRTASIMKPIDNHEENLNNKRKERPSQYYQPDIQSYDHVQAEKFLQSSETLSIENQKSLNPEL